MSVTLRMCECSDPVKPANPRKLGWCERCGYQIPPDERLRRNLDLERELVREAARGLNDPEPLIVHSETRSLQLHGQYTDDPMLVADRDLLHDAREEIADTKNYLIWWLTDPRNADDPRRFDIFWALRDITMAYSRIAEPE